MPHEIFYAETGIGCCLVKATSVTNARRQLLSQVGTLNGVQECHVATDEEIKWVHSMGGHLPEHRRTNQFITGAHKALIYA